MKEEDKKKKQPSRRGKYQSELTQYSSIAFKMGAIIFLGVWGGMKLDEWAGTPKPYITIITSLLAVSLAIYVVIKDLLR